MFLIWLVPKKADGRKYAHTYTFITIIRRGPQWEEVGTRRVRQVPYITTTNSDNKMFLKIITRGPKKSKNNATLSRRVAPSPSDRMCPLNDRRTKWMCRCWMLSILNDYFGVRRFHRNRKGGTHARCAVAVELTSHTTARFKKTYWP